MIHRRLAQLVFPSKPGGVASGPVRPIRRGRSRRAFTFAELVVVLAILATMAAIASPRYVNSLSNYRSRAAAQRIVADLNYAQTRARTTGREVPVIFSKSTHSFRMPGTPDPLRPAAEYVVSLIDDPYHVRLVTTRIGDGRTLTYDGFGQARDVDGRLLTEPAQIAVESGSTQWIVEVNHLTGEASLP